MDAREPAPIPPPIGISTNAELVDYYRKHGPIKAESVAQAMLEIDRGMFVPSSYDPYTNDLIPIGYGAVMASPQIHAKCLQLVAKWLKPGKKALDVGSGSGYISACLAVMVAPNGTVVGVEHVPELVEYSIRKIRQTPAGQYLSNGLLSIQLGDGRNGWEDQAPYDVIHVGAGATKCLPSLLNQLKPGGRLVIPLGLPEDSCYDLKVVAKDRCGRTNIQDSMPLYCVPLLSRDVQLQHALSPLEKRVKPDAISWEDQSYEALRLRREAALAQELQACISLKEPKERAHVETQEVRPRKSPRFEPDEEAWSGGN